MSPRDSAVSLKDVRLWSWLRQAMASDVMRKVTETMLVRVLLIAISLVTSVAIARVLGPEGRGLYAVAASIGAIGVQFGNLGLSVSNTYFVAKSRDLLPALVGNSLLVSLVLGGGGGLMAYLVSLAWPHLMPLDGPLLLLALAGVPMGLAYMLLQNLLMGLEDTRSFNAIELATKLLGAALIGAVIFFGSIQVEPLFAMGLLVQVLGAAWVLWRLKPHLDRMAQASWAAFKDSVRYGIRVYLGSFFAFMLLRADLLMVDAMLGAEQTGYYSLAVTMADMLYMLPSVLALILFPKLVRLGSPERQWSMTLRAMGLLALAMALLAAIAVWVAPPLVGLLFGAEFLPLLPAFNVLAPAMVFYGVNNLVSNYLGARHFPWMSVFIWFSAMVLNLGLNLVLIPSHGIMGAALASLIAYAGVLGAQFAYAYLGRETHAGRS